MHGEAALVDSVATFDASDGTGAVFLVNRDTEQARTVRIDVSELGATSIREALTLADDDVYAKNTLQDQNRVTLHPNETASVSEGFVTVTLPPVSWTAVAFA